MYMYLISSNFTTPLRKLSLLKHPQKSPKNLQNTITET